MRKSRIRCITLVTAVASAVFCAQSSAAETYPNRPIRMIAANSAGGGLDVLARAVAPRMAAVFGQQIVVDNRAGAAGSVASEITAKSAPDGYTVLVGSIGGLAVNTNLYQGLQYHPLRDLTGVTYGTSGSNVLVVNLSVPVKSVQELIALAKAQPDKLSFGSSGAGNAGHLAGELFKAMAKVQMVHIPYKGGAPVMVDLIAGQVQLVFASAPTAVPQVKSGRIRGLAVTTAKRSTALPDLPTVAETGLPGYEADNWYGFVVRMGTPRAIVVQLNREIGKALEVPEVRQMLFGQGLEVAPGTPEAFTAYIKSEYEKWAKVIKDAKITASY